MTKQERAAYLVNLSTLINGQFKSPHIPTQELGDEFNKHWDILVKEICEAKDER